MSPLLLAPRVTPLSVMRAVSQWPVRSQHHARRNALMASTELAARTHERQQVDEYLARHVRAWEARRGARPAVDVPSHRAGPVESPVKPVADDPPLRAAL